MDLFLFYQGNERMICIREGSNVQKLHIVSYQQITAFSYGPVANALFFSLLCQGLEQRPQTWVVYFFIDIKQMDFFWAEFTHTHTYKYKNLIKFIFYGSQEKQTFNNKILLISTC